MRKIALLLLVLGIGVSGILLTNNSTQGQQTPVQDPDDEPTVVRIGNRTKKEKAYSKRFMRSSNPAHKLSAKAKLAKNNGWKGERRVHVLSDLHYGFAEFPLPKFFGFLTCTSDAVVFGSPRSKVAHLTEDETWVYTEYQFVVKEVVKNNRVVPIKTNDTVNITRSGGLIKIEGQVLRVEDSIIKQLKKNKEYLLFLNYVPEANGYVARNPFGDFILKGNRLVSFSGAPLPYEVRTNNQYQTILDNTRKAATKCPVRANKGGN